METKSTNLLGASAENNDNSKSIDLEKVINLNAHQNAFVSDERYTKTNKKFTTEHKNALTNESSTIHEKQATAPALTEPKKEDAKPNTARTDQQDQTTSIAEDPNASEGLKLDKKTAEIDVLRDKIQYLEGKLKLQEERTNDLNRLTALLENLVTRLDPLAEKTDDEAQIKLINFVDEMVRERIGDVIDQAPKIFQNKVLSRVQELRRVGQTVTVKLCSSDHKIFVDGLHDLQSYKNLYFEIDDTLDRSDFTIETSAYKVENKLMKPHDEAGS